jgi:hypothetical protein
MVSRFRNLLRDNRITGNFLFIGILMIAMYLVVYKSLDFVVPAWVRSLGYAGWFITGFSAYVLFVRYKKTILANLALIFNLILIVEVVCFISLDIPHAEKKNFALPDVDENHVARQLGDILLPDTVLPGLEIQNGDTIFNVRYSIDHYSRRITPNHDSVKKKHALFFGCSIAFGHGIEDNQTLAWYFQRDTNMNSYNYSKSGWGTNQMLARFQYQNLSEQVSEKEGACFYVFFWDHIYRAIGTMARHTSWTHVAPYYTFEDEHLVRKNSFKDGRYLTSKIYELIYQSNIIRKFEIDFPLKLKDRHFDLVTEMILESKKEYHKQFGAQNKFYVVMYPNYIKYTPLELAKLKEYLVAKKIDFIDLQSFINYGSEHQLVGDPHPNAKTNELLAKELNRRLKANELNK